MTKSLQDQIEAGFAPAWRPNPGDTLIGFVDEISARESDYGPYPIVTVITEDGERVAVHAMQTVLQNQLVAAKPTIGEEIAFRYDGKRKPKDGKGEEYHAYRVIVHREPQNIWGMLETQQ